MRAPKHLLACAALFAAAALSQAQAPKDNPVANALLNVGAKGLAPSERASDSASKFSPGSEVYVEKYFKELFGEDEAVKLFTEVARELIKGYAAEAKANKYENDAGAAAGFALVIYYSILTGAEINEQGIASTIFAVSSALNVPEVRNASNTQKQQVYEWTLSSVALLLATAQSAKEPADINRLKELAKAQLYLVFGVKQEDISVKDGKLYIKGTGAATTSEPAKTQPSSGGGLVPGFTYTLPSGWTQEAGWIAGRHIEGGSGGRTRRISSAFFRMLPAVPANKNVGEILREQWKLHVPAELANNASGMVYRRYIGDQLPAHFICGRGREKGKISDSVFSLFVIDCGDMLQPFVIAQTYEEPDDSFTTGIEMSAGFSFPTSAKVAEDFLKTFQMPKAKGKPLIDKSALVGNYHFGSGAGLEWVNVYSGASTYSYVSYGGTLNLAANGTFTYTYSSASGVGGATSFRGAKGNGKWTLKGDILECVYENYDQGDGYKVKAHTYRVAGVVQFSDHKVIILKSNLDQPINATTVGDSSEYYSTKKKE